MGPAALGTSVESPPRSPGPIFFGDSAVSAVTKQSRLAQSLGLSTEEAAGSPGVAGTRGPNPGLGAAPRPQWRLGRDTALGPGLAVMGHCSLL